MTMSDLRKYDAKRSAKYPLTFFCIPQIPLSEHKVFNGLHSEHWLAGYR